MVAPIPRQECADPKVTKWIDLLRGILNPVVTKLGKPGFSPLALAVTWSNVAATDTTISSDPFESAGYSIDGSNVVRLRGTVVSTASVSGSAVVGSLPAGFRPAKIQCFCAGSPGAFDIDPTFIPIVVYPSGNIEVRSTFAAATPIPLDSISFVAEQ